MSVYNVFVGNPTRMSYQWQALCEAVDALFMPVIQRHPTYRQVRVRSVMEAPQVANHELLIYVLPRLTYSLPRRATDDFTQNQINAPGLHNDGLTVESRSGTTCSEVYKNWRTPGQLALVIYHEAMHNKLGAGTNTHAFGGLASASITAMTQRRLQNDQRMADALDNSIPQWLRGFAVARTYQPQADPTDVLGRGTSLDDL